MATKTVKKPVAKRVVKTKKTTTKKGNPKMNFALNVPVNVKVEGERVMRKNVVLVQNPLDPSSVLVRTGRRGRPASLNVESIERVRVL